MHPQPSTKSIGKFLSGLAVAAGAAFSLLSAGPPPPQQPDKRIPTPSSAGALAIIDRDGALCPLKHTDVRAEVSGPLVRVTVTQDFENPYPDKIEAVYTFPLPQNSAVDDMTMQVGDRTIKGIIKTREEARKIFDDARNAGHTASLLDQERPNIFTQSVTNIGPRMKVQIVISYVETLKYEAGTYEFGFPMVVGPRYMPGHITGKAGGGWSPDTSKVPDASKISPPVTPPGFRAGHDISVQVSLNAGVPIDTLTSPTHEVDFERPSPAIARVKLRNLATMPNKDFLLRWDVSGKKIEDAVLTHRGARGGFFTLLLQPPDRPAATEITPKEIVFVVDTSGSMSGFPMEKVKEVIKLSLDHLNPRDTFNLITFSGDTHLLFPQPVPATTENVRRAQQFMLSRSGSGGTEMMKAIRTALDPTDSQEHMRIVCFMTDGYVGNDLEIIGEVQKHPNARVFSFGIGSSVNRFLLDKMSEEGRGEVEYVGLNDDGSKAAVRFYERVRTPLLTDISIDWGGLAVSDVYPKRNPDLFAAKPLVIMGRYNNAAKGTIRLRGKVAGRDYMKAIPVDFPADQPQNNVLSTLWARTRVDHVMSQDWNGLQSGNPRPEVKQEITQLGLEYRLMTQFTSFVAVEDRVVVEGGKPRHVQVPVEMPHGVSYQGVFGDERKEKLAAASFAGGFVGGAAPRMAQSPNPIMMSAPPPPPRVDAPREEDRRARPVGKAPEPEAASKIDPQLLRQVASGPVAGTVRVKVWLLDDSAAALDQLKKAGLTFTAKPVNKMLLGTVSAAKLQDLARLGVVQFVSQDLGTP